MQHTKAVIIICSAILASICIMPVYALSNCDLENVYITLQAKNKSISDILGDIEEQSEFSINSDESDILKNRVSIQLYNTNLNLTFKRLLKDLNYSIICDSTERKLSLVLLDKVGSIASKQQSDNIDSSVNVMDEISAMLSEYPNIEKVAQDSLENQNAEEMDGIITAMQDFNNNISADTNESNENQDSGEMAGISRAMEEYSDNIRSGNLEMQQSQETTSMDEVSKSFNDFQSDTLPQNTDQGFNQLEESPTPENPLHPMNEVDLAMDEYLEQKR